MTLTNFALADQRFQLRQAIESDVGPIVELIARDQLRASVEAVRVDQRLRGNGLGSAMISWAIEEGRRRGAALVQLTSDNTRLDAHRFYERLGFSQSHAGFKLRLA